MVGSRFGLGGGCFRGDGRLLLSSRLNTECREGDRVDGLARDWTRPSTARGTGTELQWKCLGPALSSALGGQTQRAPPRQTQLHYLDGNNEPAPADIITALWYTAHPRRLEDARGTAVPGAS